MRPFRTATSAARFKFALLHVAKQRETVIVSAPERMSPKSLSTAIREAVLYYRENPQDCPEVAQMYGSLRVRTLKDGAQVDVWNRATGEYSHRVSFRPGCEAGHS